MREIVLTNGRVALVDDEDYERIAKSRWTYCKGRAQRTDRDRTIGMHAEVMGEKGPFDHINLNGLDNRRANLRRCDNTTNHHNARKYRRRDGSMSSRFKGVHLVAKLGGWQASITVQGQRLGIGYFDSEDDAARAYDSAARRFFGSFARLNFPNAGEQSALV